MYFAYEAEWVKQREIADAMGLGYGAVAWNYAKVRQRRDSDPKFKRKIESLIRSFKAII